ncbi:MAG: L-threonylcarbamoyladenylate synthase [Chitinophagaceae bacterium]
MFQTIIDNNIQAAAHWLNAGETVAIPTETVYGLAANALNDEAVIKIFEAKGRPRFNPLIVHTYSVEAIPLFAELDAVSKKIALNLMPGAITLLLPKKKDVPDLVTAGSQKVAIRIPNHPLTLALLQSLPFPVAAPSANPFGYVSPTTAEHVYDGLSGKIPYILNGGPCHIGVESTIVEVANNTIVIHRNGGIEPEKLTEITDLPIVYSNTKKIVTSGQLKSHYATNTPLLLGNIEALLPLYANKKIAVISFATQYTTANNITHFILSPSGNLHEAANHLFATMRTIDTQNFDVVLAEYFPNEGLGLAINDRLKRAQAQYKSTV